MFVYCLRENESLDLLRPMTDWPSSATLRENSLVFHGADVMSSLSVAWGSFAPGAFFAAYFFTVRIAFWYRMECKEVCGIATSRSSTRLAKFTHAPYAIYITTTPRAEKRNHFSFMNKSLNTQCNLTKFSTLIVNEYYRRCYLFNFWNLHYFPPLSLQKVWQNIMSLSITMVFTEEDRFVIKFLRQNKATALSAW